MLPTMYGNYTQGRRQLGVGQNDQPAGPTVVVDGVQKLTPNANAQIAGYLGQLYFGSPVPTPAEGVQTFVAMPCDQAKQSAGEQACQATAFATLESRPPGSSVLVDFGGANPTNVMVLIVTGSENVTQQEILQQMAGTDSNLALFEPGTKGKTKKEEEKKDKGATILVGAGAGGAAGFFALGPPGALVGAAAGGLLANWLAA